MPADAWDCHMHVTSPDYPLAANAAYKPALHDIKHAMAFEKTVGIRNVVNAPGGATYSISWPAVASITPDQLRGMLCRSGN